MPGYHDALVTTSRSRTPDAIAARLEELREIEAEDQRLERSAMRLEGLGVAAHSCWVARGDP